MPRRNLILAEGEVYHVINRSISSQPMFNNRRDYERFLSLIDYYRFPNTPISYSRYSRLKLEERFKLIKNIKTTNLPIVDIYAYCLMKNHFHLLLYQKQRSGILKLLSNVQNAYVKYFNTKNSRAGTLFKSRFSAKRIDTDKILVHVSRYIHLNPCTSYLVDIDNLPSYEWSSYPVYIGNRRSDLINTEKILKLLKNSSMYETFVKDQANYQRSLKRIKYLEFEK